MSNKVKAYVEAFNSSFEGVDRKEAEKRIVRFIELLKKHGDLKLASKIILGIQAQRELKNTVVSASALPKKTKEKIEKLLGGEIKESVNPNVIGGMALFLNNEFMIDGTVKRKITKIFS